MFPARSFGRSGARAFKRARGPTRKLPASIDFLQRDLPTGVLLRIADQAARIGASPSETLIAEGWLDEAGYYKRLAAHLDVDFIAGAVAFAGAADWRAALRTGVIRMADGRWLMAPRGAALAQLLSGVESQRFAIAAPEHFERAILNSFAREIAEEGAEALARSDPDFCARRREGARPERWIAVLGLLLVTILFPRAAWLVAALLVGVVMAVAVLVRILATLLALAPRREPPAVADIDLPFYSVLVALYREEDVATRLLDAMAALDYPRTRHEIILLVEEDDVTTLAALASRPLPSHVRIVVAPAGMPRTKPRALNIGLLVARGDLLVIYDAEDRPAPDQLRKAAAAFRAGSPKVAVLQAELSIENRSDSWLTRLFAIDYAVQFQLLLPGLSRLGLPLPLGGTSNHFRTHILRSAGGWDAWNVTEDADLGLRLARLGYRAGTLDSITQEEAPPGLRDWYPQRRRWLKGWMQTVLTHTRDPVRLYADLGLGRATHALALLASNTLGPAIGMWVTCYVLHASLAGDLWREADWRQLVWIWIGLAGFGVVSIIVPTLIVLARGRLWSCAAALILRPIHWLCVSAAAFHAGVELWWRPHHWSKTRHGLARQAPPQIAFVIEVASIPKSSSSMS